MSLHGQWQAEQRSAWLYERVAEAETELTARRMFQQLASAASHQADIVAKQIAAAGSPAPEPFVPGMRERVVVRLCRLFGPRRIRPALAAMKIRGLSI